MDPDSIISVCALFNCFRATLYEFLIAGLIDPVSQSDAYEALQVLLVNRGKMAFISGEQRKKANTLRGTKTIFWKIEHKKTNFRIRGKREHANLFQRNKGTGTPPSS